MVVDNVQAASVDSTTRRMQDAIAGVNDQILPGGLGGVGVGFVASQTPYSGNAALFGVHGGFVDSRQTAYSGASTLYGPNMGLSDSTLARTPLSAEPFRAQFNGPLPGVIVAGSGAGETPLEALRRGSSGGYAGVLDPSPAAAYAGKLAGEAAQHFRQFGYALSGAESMDVARAEWGAGNYLMAGAKGLQAIGEAGLTLTGAGGAMRSVAARTVSNVSAGTALDAVGQTGGVIGSRFARTEGLGHSITHKSA
ncbi:hypothetical protein WJ74_27535 [Burkholderia ubonensis]|nr:hypothetical protein WJ74_27535 [Burkholderia ubonensis]KWB90637.1 hypothetical protein WL44_13860 [Burkholderia ubonensis]